MKNGQSRRMTALLLSTLILFTLFIPALATAATILARQYVTNTVHLRGGYYASPYIVSTPNTEYVLDGDITAAGTAIIVKASKVVVNLNGKTIVYNNELPGEGIAIGDYNKSDIAIINGAIRQGAALSEGDQYGVGNNPILTKPGGVSYAVVRLQVAGISATYGGRDVAGFVLTGEGPLVEDNTLTDTYEFGTVKNRHQGIDAIIATGQYGIIRNNTIVNSRHRGINPGSDAEVYSNTIGVRSICTNGAGVFVWDKVNVKIHDNTINGVGEHPIGIIAHGNATLTSTSNVEIYGNTITLQVTRLGWEYGSSSACWNPLTPCGEYAIGIRSTTGATGLKVHDNIVNITTNSKYLGHYSVTGEPVLVDGKGRGLMASLRDSSQTAHWYNNTVSVLDADGTGKAFGITCGGDHVGVDNPDAGIVYEGNSVTSNILNIAVSDAYGACKGYPLFMKNTLIKSGNYAAYKTYAAELNGYFEATARFISNTYIGGASQENININADGNGLKSFYFGREINATLLSLPSNPIAGATLTVNNGGGIYDSKVTTNASGAAKIIVYDYEMHDNNNTSNVALTRYLAPHTINADIASSLFNTQPDTSLSAWDATTSKGVFNLGLYVNGQSLDSTKKLVLSIPDLNDSSQQAPYIFNGTPSAEIPADASQVTLSVMTNKVATCRFGSTTAVPFASIPNTFSLTGGILHSSILTDLSNGQSYNYYIRCQDAVGNTNTTDYLVNFLVNKTAAIAAPTGFKVVK